MADQGSIAKNTSATASAHQFQINEVNAYAPQGAARDKGATTVSGTVYESGSPVARVVRAYRRHSGALLGQTTSDASTGAFSIPVRGTREVYVIAFDDTGTAPDYNAIIQDLVVPG